MRRFILILLMIAGTALSVSAQTPVQRKGDRNRTGTTTRNVRPEIMDIKIDMKTPPIEHGTYSDDKMKEIEDMMNERAWATESTAWDRASALNSKEAYQRYVAQYPNGPHRADASQRIIDIEVEDIFNSDHGRLPQMKHVSQDDDSPTSTIFIENHTDHPLTVRFSGTESKSIVISPRGKGNVRLANGQYRIGASVPDRKVRPYAGSEDFQGGGYETGYVIVNY